MFATCAVTCVHSRSTVKVGTPEHNLTCPDVPWSVSYSELEEEQHADGSLGALLGMALHVCVVKNHAGCTLAMWLSILLSGMFILTAFENVKPLICNAPVLAAPQWDRDFKIEVDGSFVCAGEVLLQCDDLGVDKSVISCGS